ncbi:MAG TPA: hypothetical protein PKM88_12875, partial [bacterium]|nr:hypothetical protein [bacterium]
VAFACQLLAGHPQLCYYTGLLLVARHGWLLFRRECGMPRWRFLLLPLLALGLAGVLAAPQFLPAAELLRHSTRVSAVDDYAMFTYWSLEPRSAVRMVMPYLYGSGRTGDYWQLLWRKLIGFEEYYLYLGVVPLLLVILAVARRRWPDPQLFYIVVLGTTLLLAVGKHLPFCRWAYDWLPGFHLFRWPVRLLVLHAFAGAVLAGGGWRQLWTERSGRAWSRPVAAILMLLAAGYGFWLVYGRAIAELVATFLFGATTQYADRLPVLVATIGAALQRLTLVTTGLLAVATLHHFRPQWRRRAQLLLLLILVAECVWFLRGFAVYNPSPLYPDLTGLREQIPAGARCWFDTKFAWRNAGTLYRAPSVDGYDPLVLREYAALIRPAAGRDADENNPLGTPQLADPVWARLRLDHLVLRPGAVPDTQSWSAVATTAAGTLFRRRSAQAAFSDAVVRPDAWQATVVLRAPGMVEVPMLNYPGWCYRRPDGELMPVTGELLRTPLLPAGTHRVTFEYRPTVFRRGVGLMLLAAVGIAGLLRCGRRQSRRNA